MELSPTKNIPRNDDTANSTFTIFNPYLKSSNTSVQSSSKSTTETTSFGKPDEVDNMPPPPLPTTEEMVDNVLSNLASKKLRHGYASYIMEQGDFHNWIHLAKEDKAVWPWFVSFTEDLLDVQKSQMFDECCRHIMDKLISFEKDAMLNRKLTSADSYEYRLFHFLVSKEFQLICSTMLSTNQCRQ